MNRTHPSKYGAKASGGLVLAKRGSEVLWLFLVVSLLGHCQLFGQVQSPGAIKGAWSVTEYYKENPNRLKSKVNGVGAQLLPSGVYQCDLLQVSMFTLQGRTNLVIEGTNCSFDLKARIATSSEILRVHSDDREISLQGRGFTWWQTNNYLVISNNILAELGGLPKTTGPNPSTATNDYGTIAAGRLEYDQTANRILFRDGVRVDSGQMAMNSHQLAIRHTGEPGIEGVEAEGEVEVIHKPTDSHIRAGRATYSAGENAKIVEFTDHPLWKSGSREGQANFLRIRITDASTLLEGDGGVQLLMPRSGKEGLVLFASIPSVAASQPDSNSVSQASDLPKNAPPIRILSESMKVELPPQQGSIRYLLLQTNISIEDASSQSRVTGQRAEYHEGQQMQLTGAPQWSSPAGSIRAEFLFFDPATGSFGAKTNVVANLNVARMAGEMKSTNSQFLIKDPNRLNAAALELSAGFLVSQDNLIRCSDQVHARLLSSGMALGEVECREMTASLSEGHLQTLTLQENVQGRRFSFTNHSGKVQSGNLECQRIIFRFRPDSSVETLQANGSVKVRGEESAPGKTATNRRSVECDEVWGSFEPGQRMLGTAWAKGGVKVLDGLRMVTAEKADYDGARDRLALTGNPIVQTPEAEIRGANSLVWDRRRGGFSASGPYRTLLRSMPGSTNNLFDLRSLRWNLKQGSKDNN